MGLIDVARRRLLFWRKRPVSGDLSVDGCFTLPGAELGPRDATGACGTGEAADAGAETTA